MGRKAIAGLAAAAIALSAAPASAALPDGDAYAPRNGRAYHGVSDTGKVADFDAFAPRSAPTRRCSRTSSTGECR